MLQKNLLIYAAVAVALYFLYKMFFGKSKEQLGREKVLENSLLQSDYYARFLKKYRNKVVSKNSAAKKGFFAADVISASETERLAKTIWDAKSPVMGIGDKDESAINAFESIPTQTAVAMVAKRFKEMYGRNLASFLDFMDNRNMKRLNDIIAVKPTGLFSGNTGKWVELSFLPKI